MHASALFSWDSQPNFSCRVADNEHAKRPPAMSDFFPHTVDLLSLAQVVASSDAVTAATPDAIMSS